MDYKTLYRISHLVPRDIKKGRSREVTYKDCFVMLHVSQESKDCFNYQSFEFLIDIMAKFKSC